MAYHNKNEANVETKQHLLSMIIFYYHGMFCLHGSKIRCWS